jgi:hypothetical protein
MTSQMALRVGVQWYYSPCVCQVVAQFARLRIASILPSKEPFCPRGKQREASAIPATPLLPSQHLPPLLIVERTRMET